MVVGGGIGGMQSALDLAESGLKVYLVENKPCVGGVMAQLDKTFPTNDCAMCTMAPRLVELGRHKDIEIITLADTQAIKGKPGNFTVTINKRPRYVKEDKCTGCGICTETCPVRYAVYPDPEEAPPIEISEEDKKTIDDILAKHKGEIGELMSILKDASAAFNYLPQNILRYTAREVDAPLSLLHRIATFYSGFSLTPKGRNIIRICQGTTCYVRGAKKLLARLRKELDIGIGETTPDMKFTLESVRCLGCCSLAPVITVGDETFGRVKEKEIPGILEQYE
jgi:NADH:ubiquinone oxidoreductase subunit E/NAD-dependent dihydropyrimidine dehydrogenase PreA subunit